MAKQRVQKIIASVGLCSRRTAEEWIEEGLVTINGQVAKLGDQADLEEDAIKVKGKLLQSDSKESKVYILFHKPKHVISMVSEDPEGRPTLKEYFKRVHERVFPIGRLEFTQEGLLVLTNDGNFAEQLRVSPKILRIYRAKIAGHASTAKLEELKKPMRMGGKLVEPKAVRAVEKLSKKTMIEIAFEGMGSIDIKEFLMRRGFLLDRLVLTSIGHITIEGLAPGEFRYLKKTQMQALIDQPELGMGLVGEQNEYLNELLNEAAAVEEAEAKIAKAASQSGAGAKTAALEADADSDSTAAFEAESEGSGPEARSSESRVFRGKSGLTVRKKTSGWGGARGGARSERESFGGGKRGFGERGPRKTFGERKPYGEKRGFSERSERSDFSRGERSERGPRKAFGDRPARGPRKEFGDRPARGGYTRGERSERSSFGDRPARKSFGERGPRKEFSERSERGGFKSRGGRPSEGGLRIRKKPQR